MIELLEKLTRYDPYAEFCMTGNSLSNQPIVSVSAHMRDTGNPVHKGYGTYVKFDDILHLMVKSEMGEK